MQAAHPHSVAPFPCLSPTPTMPLSQRTPAASGLPADATLSQAVCRGSTMHIGDHWSRSRVLLRADVRNRSVLASSRRGRSLRSLQRACLRVVRGATRAPRSLRPLPLGAPGTRTRGAIRHRAGARLGRRLAPRRSRRRRRRSTAARPLSPVPLRGPQLARRDHPGHRRGNRESAAPQRRSRAGAATARTRAAGANACVGP